jgi:uncharacterized protein (UPF0303 family)
VQDDLERIAEQERRLRFGRFDEATAWQLGTMLRDRAVERGLSTTIEVRLGGHTVFLTAMPGTAPANTDWARRKRNVVEVLRRSSYAVGLEAKAKGHSMLDEMALPHRDHASHGGAFPIVVEGTGMVGVVTVSGLPQREDHELVVEVLAEMCGAAYDDIRLSPHG